MNPADWLPVLERRARRLNGRSAEQVFLDLKIIDIFAPKVSDKQHARPTMGKHSQMVIFPDCLWTARFRVLPETDTWLIGRDLPVPVPVFS
jgi:hypothetical protein